MQDDGGTAYPEQPDELNPSQDEGLGDQAPDPESIQGHDDGGQRTQCERQEIADHKRPEHVTPNDQPIEQRRRGGDDQKGRQADDHRNDLGVPGNVADRDGDQADQQRKHPAGCDRDPEDAGLDHD